MSAGVKTLASPIVKSQYQAQSSPDIAARHYRADYPRF
jgi:hypothetical protein